VDVIKVASEEITGKRLLGVFFTLKMEALCFSEPSDYFRTTQRYNPRSRVLHYERGLISLWLYKENNKPRD
jgi:hypothetical protein